MYCSSIERKTAILNTAMASGITDHVCIIEDDFEFLKLGHYRIFGLEF